MRGVINLSDANIYIWRKNWPWEKPIQHHLWKPEGYIPNDSPCCQQHSHSVARGGLLKLLLALSHWPGCCTQINFTCLRLCLCCTKMWLVQCHRPVKPICSASCWSWCSFFATQYCKIKAGWEENNVEVIKVLYLSTSQGNVSIAQQVPPVPKIEQG